MRKFYEGSFFKNNVLQTQEEPILSEEPHLDINLNYTYSPTADTYSQTYWKSPMQRNFSELSYG